MLSQDEHKQLVDSSQHIATVEEISAAANTLGMSTFLSSKVFILLTIKITGYDVLTKKDHEQLVEASKHVVTLTEITTSAEELGMFVLF